MSEGSTELTGPSSNTVFWTERLDDRNQDNIMVAMKNRKNKIPDALLQADQIKAALDYGIDIDALIDNLKRTPEERIRRHQIALNTAEKLREARHP